MSTAFSKIVAAVVAALSAGQGVCETIYRARVRDLPDQVDQAVNVFFTGAMPDAGAITGAPIDWSTRLVVECYARSTSDEGDLAVDPLFKRAYECLAQDSTLGGLVDDFAIAGIEAENSAEAKRTGWVRLSYNVQHRTSNQTLD